MKKLFVFYCVAFALGAGTTAATAQIYNGPNGATTRCPADESGCTIYNAPDRIQDRVNQGKRDVEEADSPLDKAKEVGKTVRDCMNCGLEAVKGAVKGESAR